MRGGGGCFGAEARQVVVGVGRGLRRGRLGRGSWAWGCEGRQVVLRVWRGVGGVWGGCGVGKHKRCGAEVFQAVVGAEWEVVE